VLLLDHLHLYNVSSSC